MSELFNKDLKAVQRNQHHGVHCHCRRRDTLVQKKASLLVELGCRGVVGRLPGFSEYISLLLAPINVVDLTTEQSHSPLTTADFTITHSRLQLQDGNHRTHSTGGDLSILKGQSPAHAHRTHSMCGVLSLL